MSHIVDTFSHVQNASSRMNCRKSHSLEHMIPRSFESPVIRMQTMHIVVKFCIIHVKPLFTHRQTVLANRVFTIYLFLLRNSYSRYSCFVKFFRQKTVFFVVCIYLGNNSFKTKIETAGNGKHQMQAIIVWNAATCNGTLTIHRFKLKIQL